MLLLLFAVPFIWEPADKSTIGHLSVGYVSTDIVKVLCKDQSLWKQNTNALLVTFMVGYGIEMLNKKKSATDLFATITGGVCKIVFDHFFNNPKPKVELVKRKAKKKPCPCGKK